ncbi:protein RALF-like 22 [Brachypodium distachyon]|uniref:Rapid alkalinization factor 1 n=1 Tax=Brachypodium distachyon TaxID=15368 RepID=I1H5K5_BRADI|nr:protein RALF-like 22 [Brachypodium distachyon]KQK21729.1 hypothetical protein BRADI_1g62710v3 [Brachypodium distachyon]|eukprot:XP_003561647.1 protein RALF-like 22 [Brachypodium distachyon]
MPRHALLLLVAALAVSATAAAELASDSAGRSSRGTRSCGGGTVEEECLGDGGLGLSLRRRLHDEEEEEQAQYISYSALRRDSVPCSVPGMSYYNCQPDAEANPYTRGCSAITQCRG